MKRLRNQQPKFRKICDRALQKELTASDIQEINRHISRFHPYLMSEEEDWVEELIQGSFIITPPGVKAPYPLFYRWVPSNGEWEFTSLMLHLHWHMVYNVIATQQLIKRCKSDDCNNICLKKGKKLTCSDKCAQEVKHEKDRERNREKRETDQNHQILCDLIELWLKLSGNDEWLKEVESHTRIAVSELKKELKGEGERISARQLKVALESLLTHMLEIPVEQLKKYLTDHKMNYTEHNGIYKQGSTKIPFLGDCDARSLGGLLKEVKTKLEKEKGIEINPERLTKSDKKKKWATYQFMVKR